MGLGAHPGPWRADRRRRPRWRCRPPGWHPSKEPLPEASTAIRTPPNLLGAFRPSAHVGPSWLRGAALAFATPLSPHSEAEPVDLSKLSLGDKIIAAVGHHPLHRLLPALVRGLLRRRRPRRQHQRDGERVRHQLLLEHVPDADRSGDARDRRRQQALRRQAARPCRSRGARRCSPPARSQRCSSSSSSSSARMPTAPKRSASTSPARSVCSSPLLAAIGLAVGGYFKMQEGDDTPTISDPPGNAPF